jgi:hypothetical protein
MKKKDLWDWAINNIEQCLYFRFFERKMTKKLREQIADDMAIIASNAYCIGYYAHALEIEGKTLTVDGFDIEDNEYLEDIMWKIREAGK